jgi:predicted DNA-binding protein
MKNEARLELRLPMSLVKRIRKAAKSDGRTMSNFIRFVIEKYLRSQESTYDQRPNRAKKEMTR